MPDENKGADVSSSEKMTPQEVEEIRQDEKPLPAPFPGVEQDGDMPSAKELADQEQQWRPSDEAHESNPPVE